MLNIKTTNIITVQDWDDLVSKTYGRTYSFQQQDNCKDRGTFYLTIPDTPRDYANSTIPEEVNGEEMGVSFEAWLQRDPKQLFSNLEYDWELDMFWERNFYPDVQMIANDLHAKGLIPAGNYGIEIDW